MGFYVANGKVSYDETTPEIKVFVDDKNSKTYKIEWNENTQNIEVFEVDSSTPLSNEKMVDPYTDLEYLFASSNGLVYLKKILPETIVTVSGNEEILGNFYYLKLGTFYRIFVKTSKENPVLKLKNSNGEVFEQFSSNRYGSSNKVYYFDVFLGELGETTSTGKIWQDGFFVFEIELSQVDDSIIKPVQILREDEWFVIKSDLEQTSISSSSETNSSKAFIQI